MHGARYCPEGKDDLNSEKARFEMGKTRCSNFLGDIPLDSIGASQNVKCNMLKMKNTTVCYLSHSICEGEEWGALGPILRVPHALPCHLLAMYLPTTPTLTDCVGHCLAQTARALGISMTVGAGVGLSSTHPSALKQDWSLRFGKPLITPSWAAPEYLSCIFTSSLTGAQPWLHNWGAQILPALSWV